MTIYERRYHATWMVKNGLSPLAALGTWMGQHGARLAEAPRDLLAAAAADVATRLPVVAAREPTRRHRKHFAWLLGWYLRLSAVVAIDESRRHVLGEIDDDGNKDPAFRRYRYVCRCGRAGAWRDSAALARGEHDVHRTAAKEDA